MSQDPRGPRHASDRFRQESDRRYLILVLVSITLIAGFLIGLIFGWEALLTALPCLLGGALLVLLPWLTLALIQKWRDRFD